MARTKNSFAYDGKRATKSVGGTTTSFVSDVNRGLPVVLGDGTRKPVWGLGPADAVDATGALEVYHPDGPGSVRAITDGTGTIVQTYQTDEFGVPTQSQGTIDQPFQYTGEPRDAETGFVYLRARLYDPPLGRFLQRDPFPGVRATPCTLNRSAYVRNNPVNRVDPSGLKPEECGGPPEGIPYGPDEVDVVANMQVAFAHAYDLQWFWNTVKSEGPWDLKFWYGAEYEDSGNFHFGAIARAWGWTEYQALAGAGYYQRQRDIKAGGPLTGTGVPFLVAPYGDQPRDYEMVRLGSQYYGWYRRCIDPSIETYHRHYRDMLSGGSW